MFDGRIPSMKGAFPMFDMLSSALLETKAAGMARDRRPRLLMRAARHGAAMYSRERDLKGLMPAMATSRRKAADVAARLALVEEELERRRRVGAPEYSVRRHVGLLSALVAERRAARGAAVR